MRSKVWQWVRLKKGWEPSSNPPEKGGNLLDAWNYVYLVDPADHTVLVLVAVDDRQDVTGRDLTRAVALTQDGGADRVVPDAAGGRGEVRQVDEPAEHPPAPGDHPGRRYPDMPVLLATLLTNGIITGYKNRQEVDDVVQVLNSGELGVRLGDPVREERFGRP